MPGLILSQSARSVYGDNATRTVATSATTGGAAIVQQTYAVKPIDNRPSFPDNKVMTHPLTS